MRQPPKRCAADGPRREEIPGKETRMTELLALLGAFYACDLAITEAGRAPMGAEICMETAEELSLSFLSEAERAAHAEAGPLIALDLYVQGYTRFRAWEEENPELVRDLRRRARIVLRGDKTA